MNYVAGQTVANAVTVAVGTGGAVCVFSLAATHVVVDVTGWYSAADRRLSPPDSSPVVPARLLDTRTPAKVAAGGTVAVPVPVGAGYPPTGVTAVTLNVTAADAEAPGYLTVFPCGGARRWRRPSTTPAPHRAQRRHRRRRRGRVRLRLLALDGPGRASTSPASSPTRPPCRAAACRRWRRCGSWTRGRASTARRLAGGRCSRSPVGPLLDQAAGGHTDRQRSWSST